MRLGIFGGSFDPVHNGHLELARSCQDQAGLDEVWFTPAARQPLKTEGPFAAAEDRCRMLQLATAGQPSWKLYRLEIDRGGTSYTVDTLARVRADHPDAELYFLMGADALRDLPQWHEPQEICRLATPLVARRAGREAPDFASLLPLIGQSRVEEIRQASVEMPEVPVSSTEIRRRVAAGDSGIADLTPPSVADYIASRELYRADTA